MGTILVIHLALLSGQKPPQMGLNIAIFLAQDPTHFTTGTTYAKLDAPLP